MSIIGELTAMRDVLYKQSSTSRCGVEKLLLIERILKMARQSIRGRFCCGACPLWEEDKGSEPGWAMCCYDNTLPETFEKHWCYQGFKLVNEEKDD